MPTPDEIRERFGDITRDDVFDALDHLIRARKPSPTSGPTYLTWLAPVLRSVGLLVIEYQGWQTRARSSGGYAAPRPWCVMWHHTASPASWDGQKDADYCAVGDEDAPLCNLYIQRDGTVWVLAAGATNTNGKGNVQQFSRGTVPMDQMNTHAVGVEMGNDGVGEQWPQAQIDAAFKVSNVVNLVLGNIPEDCCTHHHYAPDRKIDPAVATSVAGAWQPRSINSNGTWNVDDIRAECRARWSGDTPPPQPQPGPDPSPPQPAPPDEDDMRLTCFLDPNGTIWVGNGVHRRALTSMDQFSQYVLLSSTGGGPILISANGVQVRELGHVASVGHETIDALGLEMTNP